MILYCLLNLQLPYVLPSNEKLHSSNPIGVMISVPFS